MEKKILQYKQLTKEYRTRRTLGCIYSKECYIRYFLLNLFPWCHFSQNLMFHIIFKEILLDADEVPQNLFDILFKCQSVDVPWRKLLAYSISLHRSLLSVLAACFQVSCLSCVHHSIELMQLASLVLTNNTGGKNRSLIKTIRILYLFFCFSLSLRRCDSL